MKNIVSKIKKDWMLYSLLVPILIWYLIFAYKPMYGLLIAFKDFSLYKGIALSPWVGLQNFHDYITGPFFVRTLRNTLLISTYSLLIEFPIPLILALMLNEVKNTVTKKWILECQHFFVQFFIGKIYNLNTPIKNMFHFLNTFNKYVLTVINFKIVTQIIF